MVILFSIVAEPIYIPSNSALGFPFVHILADTCYSFFHAKAVYAKWLPNAKGTEVKTMQTSPAYLVLIEN